MKDGVIDLAAAGLRGSWPRCVAAGVLPLPVLMVGDPSENAVVGCCYLGIASAWLATEVFRDGGLPESRRAWCGKMVALVAALAFNVGLFVMMGLSTGATSGFPFPLMAALSACPAVGLVPWLTSRVRDPYAALVLAAVIVGSAKIAGCVAARVAYGPNFQFEGYIAADWRTAKLMISAFWALNVGMAVGFAMLGYWRVGRGGKASH